LVRHLEKSGLGRLLLDHGVTGSNPLGQQTHGRNSRHQQPPVSAPLCHSVGHVAAVARHVASFWPRPGLLPFPPSTPRPPPVGERRSRNAQWRYTLGRCPVRTSPRLTSVNGVSRELSFEAAESSPFSGYETVEKQSGIVVDVRQGKQRVREEGNQGSPPHCAY
jgi:hypothetical protein